MRNKRHKDKRPSRAKNRKAARRGKVTIKIEGFTAVPSGEMERFIANLHQLFGTSRLKGKMV